MSAPAGVPLPHPSIALVCGGWPSQPRWTILDTSFSAGLRFLDIWQLWRSQETAPHMLHYVGLISSEDALALPAALPLWAAANPSAAALANQLASQCFGLNLGFHRILLEQGRLSVTLCVGDLQPLLAQQAHQADSVLAHAAGQAWDKWALKALARCCKRGTQAWFHRPSPAPELLQEAGFHWLADRPDALLEAVYQPRWQLRTGRRGQSMVSRSPARCAVIGAGIAGASVARALAVRGWQVDVYDAQIACAGGASGLPVGLVVPHHSADDSPRSRMSRAGTRLTLQHASERLTAGYDWQPGGVLERDMGAAGLSEAQAESRSRPTPQTPPGWAQQAQWEGMRGLWHPHAAWIKPARLVQQWLEHPGIAFHGGCVVQTLQRLDAQWQLNRADGQTLGRADVVVFANAYAVAELVGRLASDVPADGGWLPHVLKNLQALQAIPGTLSMGAMPQDALAPESKPGSTPFPPFPVNGHGSFVSGIPTAQGPQWYAGSTFQLDAQQHANLTHEHAANLHKLQALLPPVAHVLASQFANRQVQTWQGARCVSHDRLPLVGPLDAGPAPSLWMSAGMGARGLSFSALCAELLAAWLGGEPLPVETGLANALSTNRAMRKKTTHSLLPTGHSAG